MRGTVDDQAPLFHLFNVEDRSIGVPDRSRCSRV